MVSTPLSSSDSSDLLKLENNETTPNRNPEPNSSDDAFEAFLMSTSPSAVFVRRLADGALHSATLAAAFGFGLGLVNNQGFEGSFGVASHFAKTLAYVTGVYGLVECSLNNLEGLVECSLKNMGVECSLKNMGVECSLKNMGVECSLKNMGGNDGGIISTVFDAGVAGCCVGLAINPPGTPPLQNCLTAGAFTLILEGLVNKHPAFNLRSQSHFAGVLPPLALPLPNELKESFSSFCESIGKCNKTNVQAGPR